ncbi:MOSC domain-containing protein [Pseudoroseicyclus sp. CXY001]|uniref:MOSC domain-containing protein n=1 Tax=Pseudoroseicyclus sp. CXY001 TaxID=3242492 RepID=UPI00358DC341
MALSLGAIARYPLKSGRAELRWTTEVGLAGLAGDRRLMAVDPAGRALTAREVPALLSLSAVIDGGEAVLGAEGAPPLTVPLALPMAGAPAAATLWGETAGAFDAGDAAARWLTARLERPCRLVIDDPARRRRYSAAPLAFPDSAPVMLLTRASLDALNARARHDFSAWRFRPNLVIEGAEPFAEDGWRQIRIGKVTFTLVEPCARCVMVDIDPETGARDSATGPLAHLGRFRRGEGGEVLLGQLAVPEGSGRISLGEPVEVLEVKPAPVFLPPMPRLTRPVLPAPRPLRLVLTGRREEAGGMTTYHFRPDGPPPPYLAGQFLTLEAEVAGEVVHRNFTLSSSPTRPGLLSVTIRRRSEGVLSPWLHRHLRSGMALAARGPFGRFVLEELPEDAPLLLLTAGSGITPALSMLRALADRAERRDLHLVHAARSRAAVPFAAELKGLREQMGASMRLSLAISTKGGRLDAARLAELVPDAARRAWLVCGPAPFRDMARAAHEAAGGALPFFTEAFTAGETGEDPTLAFDLRFERSGAETAGTGSRTLLEHARALGVALPSACEAGLCGTCRCRVTQGRCRPSNRSADPEASVLTDEEKAEGLVLACTSIPEGRVRVDL